MIRPATAQDEPPFAGPLLTTVNAAQDSVMLIEVDTGRTRWFSLGEGLIHHVWDFSPDGCSLLITTTGGDGQPQMAITTLTGEVIRAPVQYTELPASQWGAWEPDWSPDGSKIAFRMMRDGLEGEPERQYHVAWVEPTGSEPTFYSVTGREHSPKWSPNGEWLAYVSYDLRAPGIDAESTAEPEVEAETEPEGMIREADLWVVAADSSAKYRLTAYDVGSVRGPRWSPDGASIGYVYSPSPSNDTYWVVANRQHAQPLQITFGYSLSLDLTWTPDGQLLASARSLGGQTTHALWTIPLSAGADTRVSLFADPARLPYPDYPAFSPDGHFVALRSGYRAGLLNTETGAVNFVAGVDGNMPLIWSPAAFIGEGTCNIQDNQ